MSPSSWGTVESRARPVTAPWPGSASRAGRGHRTGSMPLWPPEARLAILGQRRAFLHAYLEAR